MSHFNGEVDIYYASAGTGKTHTLIECVKDAVKEGYEPERIAFVTFTKAGAEVAQRRTAEYLKIPLKCLNNFRTIHSMAYRGTNAKKAAMMNTVKYREFGEKMGFDFSGYTDNGVLSWDAKGDTNLITLDQLYRNNAPYARSVMNEKIDYTDLVNYMMAYKKYKETFGYTDFTDLLENYDTTEDVDVVCLDEMQDSSLLQWEMLLKAFARAKRIFVAGDIKQSIYTWAGAAPETLLHLRGNVHYLNISWRVPSKILDFVNTAIVPNMRMKDHTDAKSAKEGGIVSYLPDIEAIDDVFDINKTWFFLSRMRSQQEALVDWCRFRGIPYSLNGTPAINRNMKFEYKEGRTDGWDPEDKAFADLLNSKGLIYSEPVVKINTIHTVKGDEADCVVLLTDMNRRICRSMEIDADAEHHVFYVACTRAKEALYIIEPSSKWNYPYII